MARTILTITVLVDVVPLARQSPISKNYQSKFLQTFSGNQGNAASKSPALEERKDSQAIDPLSHVRLELLGFIDIMMLKKYTVYPQ